MQLDLPTIVLACAGIALAVLVAVVAGKLTARLFFHASGLDPKEPPTRSDEPLH